MFKTEAEEAEFWASHDSSESAKNAKNVADLFVFAPKLVKRIQERAKMQQIALRLQTWQIEKAKSIAKTKHVPYQTLIRDWIQESIIRESKGISAD